MPRPVALFTGRWADLPLATLAAQARDFGYDGLELACRGFVRALDFPRSEIAFDAAFRE